MNRSAISDRMAAFGFFLFAFALRFFHVGECWYWVDDGVIHVPSATAYARAGIMGPDDWWTQPFKHLLLYGDILLFGNTPVGWRMRNVLLGAGVVAITYLVSRAAFRRPFPAVAAAVVVALDPLSIAWSRNTAEDMPATFFILLGCLFFLWALRSDKDRHWIWAGLAIGVAGALRWYAIFPAFLMLIVALIRNRARGRAALSRLVGYLALLPASVYIATFLPWAGRGFSFAEMVQLNLDSFVVQAAGLKGVHGNLEQIAGANRWFTQWVGATIASYRPNAVATMLNDLPVWLTFVPSVAFLLYRAIRAKRWEPAFLAGAFILICAFFLTAKRPILLYSAIPLVPLGAIALGFSADFALKRYAWVLLAGIVAWCVYLYPIVSGIPIDPSAYNWLLARVAGG